MVIQRLLGDMPAAAFLERHYFRIPLSRPGAAEPFASLASWPAIEAILAGPGVDGFLAREGRRGEGDAPPSYEEARRRFAEGFTLVIRNAQKHDAGLAELARGFESDFAAPVNVHLYATPPGRTGFGWHYDVEDVFILQAQGIKEYRLRRNTVHPWPLLETIPRDMKFEREATPFWTCRLTPGDWLYIPPGWWHEARAETDSITLAVGLMSPAAVALLDFLRNELVGSVIWRQRLPVTGGANPLPPDELAARCASLFADLGKDLALTLADPGLARRFLASRGIGSSRETAEA